MTFQHLILISLWILYCVVHSLLASPSIKRRISLISGSWFKFYRLGYSIFATVSLMGLLTYQINISSLWVLHFTVLRSILGSLLIIPGICIMAISICRYFLELSGIQALRGKSLVVHLQRNGLHSYVRHPLYLGTLLSIWGLLLIFPSLANLISCIVIQVYVLIGIEIEERKLIVEFGDSYVTYSLTVPRLVPKKRLGRQKK